ncbi:DUF58 domain-containing protein [Agromyces sp. CCNWLW203]|uniref:DUF58 domain-containing protein n=1 Tax=Agromyces sp. CCNWLW203 TaxID=3112842 RepID=UPI002F9619A5
MTTSTAPERPAAPSVDGVAGIATPERPGTAPRVPSQTVIALRGLWRAVAGGVRNALRLSGQALGRVFGFAAPVTRVISPLGWIVLAGAVVAFALSRIFGWIEFGFVGATLAAALLVAIAFVFGRANFSVHIELNPHRVVAGERALGRMLVTNIAAKPSIPSRMELPVGGAVAEFVVPVLAPGAEHDELFAVPTHRRAVIVAGPAITVRGDQLGLLRRTVKWTDEVELFVHPVTARLAPSASGLVRDLEGEVTKTITNDDISFHALRSYEPGDALRNVHWRTSARTGQLMVRQFEETRRSQLTIVHTTDRDAYASEDEFELAISITASIGVQVVRDGTRMSIVSERMPLSTATPTSLLDDSSRLVETSGDHANLRDFARDATKRLPPPSVVMMVGGSRIPLADFRAAETVFGLDTQTIGFRAEFGAPSRIAKVSGLTVVTIGAIGDLARVMRRVRP